MGCLSTTIRRIGGLVATLTMVGGLTARVTRVGAMTCRVGLVCGTNLGINGGIIWANDGRLLTLENGFLISAQH